MFFRVSLLLSLLVSCLAESIFSMNTSVSVMENIRRKLAIRYDIFTGETLETVNNVVPTTSCPMGFYRPQGSTNLLRKTGQRVDGCTPCPRGRYGSSTGLILSSCTGPCPTGTFGEHLGLTDVSQCERCPPGRYGSAIGLTTAHCTAKCPDGKYSDIIGSTTVAKCETCLDGYHNWQCYWTPTITPP